MRWMVQLGCGDKSPGLTPGHRCDLGQWLHPRSLSLLICKVGGITAFFLRTPVRLEGVTARKELCED